MNRTGSVQKNFFRKQIQYTISIGFPVSADFSAASAMIATFLASSWDNLGVALPRIMSTKCSISLKIVSRRRRGDYFA